MAGFMLPTLIRRGQAQECFIISSRRELNQGAQALFHGSQVPVRPSDYGRPAGPMT
jgi:hypothetical protein